MKNFTMVVALVATIAMAACSVWPPQATAADGEVTWAMPDTTVNGVPITPLYISHSILLVRSAAVIDSLSTATPVLVNSHATPPVIYTAEDPRAFYQFAVAVVDTLGRSSVVSLWSEPSRPIDSDPGRISMPTAPAVIWRVR